MGTAAKLLENCEKGLRDLAGKALAKGDYGTAAKIMSQAKVMRDLADGAKAEGSGVADRDLGPRSAESFERKTRMRAGKSAQRALHSKPAGYPKFYRNGDELIKIGWSKTDRTEYQHKAPNKVLILLASKLAIAGAREQMFNAETVLPLTGEHGVEIPNYQSYLCLAWMRSEGLVQPHGRRGYTIPNGENIVSAVNSRWQMLPQYR